jgi:hypothetical protein
MENWRAFRPPFYFFAVNQKQAKNDLEMNLYLCLCVQTAFLRISLSCCVETRIPG